MGTETGKEINNIRLCVVSPLYHPSLGGLGRQAQLLTERLAEEGLSVFVIARRMKGMPPASFSPQVKILRAWSIMPYIHTFEKVRLRNILISLSFSVSCALFLLWTRKDYTIVHFHGASLPLFINVPLLKILRKKVIAKVAAAGVGTEAGSLRGRYYGLGTLLSKLCRVVDRYVATSSEIEDGLLTEGVSGERIIRIPNFIDTARLATISDEQKKDMKKSLELHNYKLVTFSGRFIERKGIDILLAAWKEVTHEHPEARLILLGDGPLWSEMKKLAHEMEIAGTVSFRGHVNNVIDYLQVSDLFVLPSRQEGMPNSLLEAMACGLPVVATRIGGVVDIVEDGVNGIIADPGDASILAKRIRRILNDAGLSSRMSRNALQTIKGSFSLDSICAQYSALFAKLSASMQ